MNRRAFLGGLLAAPAIVRVSSIMPVSVAKPAIEDTLYVYSLRANAWKRMAMSEFLRLHDVRDAYVAGPGALAVAVRQIFGPPVNVAIYPKEWK